MSEYIEKLKDPLWQKKRLKIMEMANWKCEQCGNNEKSLQIHHGYYEKNYDPWDYDDHTLHCLCEDCHIFAEWSKRDLQFEIAKWNPKDYGILMAAIQKARQTVFDPDGER